MALGEDPEKLLRAPGGMTTTRLEQGIAYVRGRLMRTAMRSPRSIAEPRASVGLEALNPFVGGLPADPELLTELGHGEESPMVVGDEATPLVHG
jgi:hypothetical protein